MAGSAISCNSLGLAPLVSVTYSFPTIAEEAAAVACELAKVTLSTLEPLEPAVKQVVMVAEPSDVVLAAVRRAMPMLGVSTKMGAVLGVGI